MDQDMGDIILCHRFEAEAARFLASFPSDDRWLDRQVCRGTLKKSPLAGADDRLNMRD
jgi:hypothetical protein